MIPYKLIQIYILDTILIPYNLLSTHQNISSLLKPRPSKELDVDIGDGSKVIYNGKRKNTITPIYNYDFPLVFYPVKHHTYDILNYHYRRSRSSIE